IYAESNFIDAKFSFSPVTPNDTDFGDQWGLHNDGTISGSTADADIDAPEAWELNLGSDILIGMIDSGVLLNHEELTGRTGGDGPDGNEHGTNMAGVIAAEGNNNQGIAGVNWNAEIYSFRTDITDATETTRSIDNAVSADCIILNMSFGNTFGGSTTVGAAIADAYRVNSINVAAMGNENTSTVKYPAGYHGVIAVGATDYTDGRWDVGVGVGSNYGSHIEVVAPGVGIETLSTAAFSYYESVTGTSPATAMVSGIASLMLSENSNLDNDDVRYILRRSADKVSGMNSNEFTQYYGYGRANAYRALQYLNEPYKLYHYTCNNVSDDGGGSYEAMGFYDAPGIADGNYLVKPYECTKTVNYSGLELDSVKVWGRGVDSDGVADLNPNFGIGWAGTQGTVTNSSATLVTTVYKVYDLAYEFLGWYPEHPSTVEIAYSVWGYVKDPEVDISGVTSMYSYQSKQWTASVDYGTPSFHYQWHRKFSGGSWTPVGTNLSTYSCSDASSDFDLKVVVTDDVGRVSEDQMAVNVTYMNPEIDGPTSIDLGEDAYDWEVSVTGGLSPYTYAWYTGEDGEATTWDLLWYTGTLLDFSDLEFEEVPELFAIKVVVTDDDDVSEDDIHEVSTYGGGGGKVSTKIPTVFELEQNFPNPFNPVTTIRFKLPQSSDVVLTVYDATGKEVARLVDGYVSAGHHSVQWDATNFASGMYIYSIQAGSFKEIKRMTLIK
ncbi:S8 family serine peptidase, partial [candidate division KSB1 bacterium]